MNRISKRTLPNLTGSYIAVSVLFIFITIVYFTSLSRDIYSGDVGELVTAGYTCGVAHPPGYPLFSFLGCLINQIPLPIPPVTKTGLISMFSSIGGLFILYLWGRQFTKSVFISLLSVSILAFSYLFWLHAELPEVFGLNNLFILLLYYLTYMFYDTKKAKWLYLLGFSTGLAMTHHHTIVLLFPGLLILILSRSRYLLSNIKDVIIGIGFMIAGFAMYLYVPVAASFHPIINWDVAITPNNFIHLFLRRDYQTIGHGSLPIQARSILLSNYLFSLVSNYSYQILFIAVLGFVYLIKNKRTLALSFLVTFLLTGPLFVMYIGATVVTIPGWGVVERFYTISITFLALLFPIGFQFLFDIVVRILRKPLYAYAIIGYFLIIPILLFYNNYPRTKISETQIGNTYASDILSYLKPNAVIYVTGDTTAFNLWYAHYALKKRNDIGIINPPGTTNYFLDEQINAYLKSHPKTHLDQIVAYTTEDLRRKRPIYSVVSLQNIQLDSIAIPLGLTHMLVYKKDIPTKESYIYTVNKLWKQINPPSTKTLRPSEQNLLAAEIPILYANGISDVADFLLQYYGDANKALDYYRLANDISDYNARTHAGIGISSLLGTKNCNQAEQNTAKAISIYPLYRPYYAQLAYIYARCNKPKEMQTFFAQTYMKRFNSSIQDELKVYKKKMKKAIDQADISAPTDQ